GRLEERRRTWKPQASLLPSRKRPEPVGAVARRASSHDTGGLRRGAESRMRAVPAHDQLGACSLASEVSESCRRRKERTGPSLWAPGCAASGGVKNPAGPLGTARTANRMVGLPAPDIQG